MQSFTGNEDNNNASFASTFKGRNTAMSAEELRKARESRAAEALKMKDDQISMLTSQNSALLDSLNSVRRIIFHKQQA